MNILGFILVMLFFLYVIYSQQSGYNVRRFITWGCVLLGLEAGLRHIAVGPDTPTYYMLFQRVSDTSWSEVFSGFTATADEYRDPAYALIVKTFTTLVPSWQLFLMTVSAFYFYGLWRILTRYIDSLEGALLAFVLYLSLFNIVALSGLRQCITIGIAFLLIPLINDHRWKKVIPIVLLGATIHISLLFILLLVPLIILSDNFKKMLYFLSIILIPFIAVGARSIVLYMVSFMANDYYAGYANAENEGNPIVYVILVSIISIYEYLNYRKLTELKQTSFLIPSNILMTLAVPLISLDGTMIRIGQYFTLYLMVSLPLVFERVSYRKVGYFGCIAFLALKVFTSDSVYYFFWENVPGVTY